MNFNCMNGGTCYRQWAGVLACRCPPGFVGDRCQNCPMLLCFNGGHCVRDGWRTRCQCPDGFDPSTNCARWTCAKICKHTELLLGGSGGGALVLPGTCNCNCPPSYTPFDCQNPCTNYCEKNIGTHCSYDHRNKLPKCTCGEFYTGTKCETCKCESNGSCTVNEESNQVHCSCHEGFTGKFCETALQGQAEKSKIDGMLIGIPVAVVATLLVLLLVFIIYRRRRRRAQYDHKRMQDGGELNVTNPVYMRKDPGDENEDDDDEEEPLGASLIYTGNNSTNFANPMYDVYNHPSESTQMLLGSGGQNEEQELLDSTPPLRYFGTQENGSTKKNSTA